MRIQEADVARMIRACGGSRDRAAQWAPAFLEAMREGGIDTPLRIGHFISQCGHESAHFRVTTEYASGAQYEGRKDLGNVMSGDGRRFRGRGFIMLTGRYNYTAFNRWLRRRMAGAPDVVRNPQLVADLPWAMLASVYFWDRENLNAIADQGDTATVVKRVTRVINGGYNGLKDRTEKFVAVMAVLRGKADFSGLSYKVEFGPEPAPVRPAPVVIEPIPTEGIALPAEPQPAPLDLVQGENDSQDSPPPKGFFAVLADILSSFLRRG